MRSKRSRKYKNYGPIPVNEYGISAAESIPDPFSDENDTPQADSADGMTEKQLLYRQAGRRRFSGWTHLRHMNGRRSEAPLREDEFTDERRKF